MKVELKDLKARFNIEIDFFKEYLTFNEKSLKERNERLTTNIEEDQFYNPSIPMDLVYKDEIERIPSLFFSSSILMLFSILESTLNGICREIISQCGLPMHMEEYTGNNYIGKTKKFLETFGHLCFDKLDTQWIEISRYQKLRNNIIHENSTLSSDSKKLRKIHRIIKVPGN